MAKKIEDGKIVAYCVKCKAKRKMVKGKIEKSKNGRNMAKGQCHKCETKMCKFLAG